ncbi:MAG: HDOD domain-containing protein [Thermodesulfovibrio sp.]|nr:HDOD domain-containing protein [Thermodesulfovibrio sp.]
MNQVEKIRIQIQTLKKLPTLSHSAERILRLTNSELTHLDELINIIENDPPILSKVLSLANIICLGYSGPITNLKDALFKIGFNNLKNVALSISIFSLFKVSGQREKTYKRLFKHSVATGIISKYIAEEFLDIRDESSFTAGILHDLGLFALHHLYYEAFLKIENLVITGKNITEAENEVIDLDHSIIGKWLAEWWGLPEEIGEVILYHHEDPGKLDNKYRRNIALIHLANYVAEKIGYGIYDGGRESVFYESGVYSLLTLPEVGELVNHIKSEIPLEEINIL